MKKNLGHEQSELAIHKVDPKYKHLTVDGGN